MAAAHNTGLYRLLTGLYLLAVAVLCFAPIGAPGDHPTIFGIPTDKLAHVAMFIPFPPLAYLSFRPAVSVRGVLFRILLILAAGFMLGAVTELVQNFFPQRCCELQDMLADATGIVISSAFILVFKLCGAKS